jgi:hypothetical protein
MGKPVPPRAKSTNIQELTERSPLNREVSKMVPGAVLDSDGSRHHRAECLDALNFSLKKS